MVLAWRSCKSALTIDVHVSGTPQSAWLSTSRRLVRVTPRNSRTSPRHFSHSRSAMDSTSASSLSMSRSMATTARSQTRTECTFPTWIQSAIFILRLRATGRQSTTRFSSLIFRCVVNRSTMLHMPDSCPLLTTSPTPVLLATVDADAWIQICAHLGGATEER